MSKEKYICPKCGNDKRFYTDCTTPAKIEYDPYTGEYGDMFDIDGVQVDNFYEILYCRECGEVIEGY